MFTPLIAVTPVTIPVLAPTVAILILELVHVPPGVLLLNVVVWPTHTVNTPVIGEAALTVTALVAVQPAGVWNNIFTVPPPTLVTTPVPLLTVAIVISLLVHVPPPVVLLVSVSVPLPQIVLPPVDVVAASGFTVTAAIRWQPVDRL